MIRTLFAAALAALSASAAGAAAAPLEAYGRLPSIEMAAMSPDGGQVALIWTDGENRRVVFADLKQHKITRGLTAGEVKVRDLQWAGPEHLVITTSRTSRLQGVIANRAEYYMAYDYSLQTGRLRPIMDLTDDVQALNVIYGFPTYRLVNGKPTLYVEGQYFPADEGVVGLFRVNLNNNHASLAEAGDTRTADFQVGPDGPALGLLEYDSDSQHWRLKMRQPAGWREVERGEGDPPTMLGLGRDGRSLLVRDWTDNGARIREVAPDGTWSAPLTETGYEHPLFDPSKHNLIGFQALVGDENRYRFLDPKDQKAWDMVVKAFPKQVVQLASWSDDRSKVVILADSPTEGQAYAVIDLATGQATWLGTVYDKIGPDDISPVRPVRFKAADGLELSGYLTTPRGVDPKNLPLVVFPHGGPAARDEPGFDWWAQAMASRGYAVLQVNYRGSDGFGRKFYDAGFGEWGRKMQTDLSDGVKHLAGEGVIDPKRVCIVGASYGGYAAMAGAALQPDVYRCAVSVAGPTDMRRFVAWANDQHGADAERYWLNFMGAEKLKDPTLKDISPALHADAVKTPVLLIHGKDDTVVPLEQSQIMADALKKAGKPAEFMVLDGTDHWLLRGQTRLQMLNAVIAFLEKNNPPAASTQK